MPDNVQKVDQLSGARRKVDARAIVSRIFIPLTSIAGVYGMNFGMMPGIERW